jgi:filamentous hemagglutinin family protein
MGCNGIRIFLSGCIISFFITISAHAEVVTDGTLGEATSLSGPNYDISADLGQIEGSNLFHSFSQFNLSSSESANFSGPGNIQNIITRVTGGEQSFIDGGISSTIQGANLFLLNPNGILFGENASLNISGSFYASTAGYLSLGANGRFDAINTNKTRLTVAAPTAFGFLDSSVAEVKVSGSQLRSEGDISLVGGDITIRGRQQETYIDNDETSTLQSLGGSVNMISVKSIGEVTISNVDESLSKIETLGNITIDDGALVALKNSPKGSIKIRGGKLTIENSRVVSVDSGKTANSSITQQDSTHEKNAIDIVLTNDLTINTTDNADYLAYAGVRSISTDQTPDANVSISVRDISIGDTSNISSVSYGDQDSSSIDLNTRNIDIKGAMDSDIESISLGSGSSGDINISANDIQIIGSNTIRTQAQPPENEISANSGDININANRIELLQGGQIGSSAVRGSGTGGTISINSNSIYIAGTLPDSKWPGIYTTASEFSTGGSIIINTGSLELGEFGVIGTLSRGIGNGGDIHISADDIFVSNGGVISSTGFDQGDAGDITINANSIKLKGPSPNLDPDYFEDDYTGIFAVASPLGSAPGDITITTKTLEILDGAQIDNSTSSWKDGGNIDISAGDIHIAGYDEGTGNHSYIRSATVVFQGIEAFAFGEGGNVNITANNIELSDQGQISVVTDSHGDGGNLNIDVNHLTMTDDAAILAASSLDGAAGDIEINVNKALRLSDSSISTEAAQADGGDININYAQQAILQNSAISTSVLSASGNGGDITISADLMALNNSSIVATASAGMGGNITVEAQTLLSTTESVINAASEQSVNGNINLAVETDVLNGLDALPIEFADVSNYFRNECDSSRNQFSSFLVNNNPPALVNSADYSSNLISSEYINQDNINTVFWQIYKTEIKDSDQVANTEPMIVLTKHANVDCVN